MHYAWNTEHNHPAQCDRQWVCKGAAYSDPNNDLLWLWMLLVDRMFDAVGLAQNPVAAGDWMGEWSSCLRILEEFDRAKKAWPVFCTRWDLNPGLAIGVKTGSTCCSKRKQPWFRS
jgi:hypothetical protein